MLRVPYCVVSQERGRFNTRDLTLRTLPTLFSSFTKSVTLQIKAEGLAKPLCNYSFILCTSLDGYMTRLTFIIVK